MAYCLNTRPRAYRPPRAAIARRVPKLLELVQRPAVRGRYRRNFRGASGSAWQ